MVDRHKGETVFQTHSFVPVVRSIGQMKNEPLVVTDWPELRQSLV